MFKKVEREQDVNPALSNAISKSFKGAAVIEEFIDDDPENYIRSLDHDKSLFEALAHL